VGVAVREVLLVACGQCGSCTANPSPPFHGGERRFSGQWSGVRGSDVGWVWESAADAGGLQLHEWGAGAGGGGVFADEQLSFADGEDGSL